MKDQKVSIRLYLVLPKKWNIPSISSVGGFLSGYWPEGMPVMSELLSKKPIDRDGGA